MALDYGLEVYFSLKNFRSLTLMCRSENNINAFENSFLDIGSYSYAGMGQLLLSKQ